MASTLARYCRSVRSWSLSPPVRTVAGRWRIGSDCVSVRKRSIRQAGPASTACDVRGMTSRLYASRRDLPPVNTEAIGGTERSSTGFRDGTEADDSDLDWSDEEEAHDHPYEYDENGMVVMTPAIEAMVQEYASRPQTTVSLQRWIQKGDEGKSQTSTGQIADRLQKERTVLQIAGFLKDELPIRLAHRIHDLQNVPMMRHMPSVQAVKGIYVASFLELVHFEPSPDTSVHAEREFAELLEALYVHHSNILIQMAKGAYELRESVRQGRIVGDLERDVVTKFEQMESCHQFLDRFYHSRVGIRVLAGQYLAMRNQMLKPTPNDPNRPLPPRYHDYVGMICRTTSPHEIVQVASQEATRMCLRTYGDAPRVTIEGRLDLTFPYIPSHLHYIMLELLKNAMRATMENYKGFDMTKLPPVTVIIADGDDNEDVVIKVADEGGGIPRSQMDQIWSYLFTTAGDSVQYTHLMQKDHSDSSPIAGLGYGLPISRAYARYFGGELDIVSMEGYGTDAFCYLARMGSKAPLAV